MTSWKIDVKPAAEKYYLKQDKGTRARTKKALRELGEEENLLLHPDVRALTGKLHGDYRLGVRGWRILFAPDKEKKMICVYAILPRGDAY